MYGAGAHTDYGALTVLATDDTPGLQIHTAGAWQDVKPIPGTFIINVGDMLERWANSVMHSLFHSCIHLTVQEAITASSAFSEREQFDVRTITLVIKSVANLCALYEFDVKLLHC